MVRQQATKPIDEVMLMDGDDEPKPAENEVPAEKLDVEVPKKQLGQNPRHSMDRSERQFSPRRTIRKPRRGTRGGRGRRYEHYYHGQDRSSYDRSFRYNRPYDNRREIQSERAQVVQAVVTSAVRAAFDATARPPVGRREC